MKRKNSQVFLEDIMVSLSEYGLHDHHAYDSSRKSDFVQQHKKNYQICAFDSAVNLLFCFSRADGHIRRLKETISKTIQPKITPP